MERFKGKSGIFGFVCLLLSFLFFTLPKTLPRILWEINTSVLDILKWASLFLGVSFLLIALFCFIFYKTTRKCCTLPTALFALGLSGAGTAGLVCLLFWFAACSFGEAYRHPILYPCSVGFGMLSFFLVILFLMLYVVFRQKHWSFRGLLLDFATTLLFAPGFYMLELFAVEWLSRIH